MLEIGLSNDSRLPVGTPQGVRRGVSINAQAREPPPGAFQDGGTADPAGPENDGIVGRGVGHFG